MGSLDFVFWIGIVSACLGTLAFVPYAASMIWGRTQPLRSTWLIWAVLATMSFLSNVDVGATASLPYVGLQAGMTIVIFLLSLRYGCGGMFRQGEWQMLLAAIIGIALWTITSHAFYALFISIGVSALAGAATLRKAYLHPNSESKLTWSLAALGAAGGIISVGVFEPLLLLYPMYLLVLYSGILLAMYLGTRHAPVVGHAPEPVPLMLSPRQRVSLPDYMDKEVRAA